ncbi:MAG: lipoprotein insertase outer membrane protein LolB [Gammaproteobacteria bacterium]
MKRFFKRLRLYQQALPCVLCRSISLALSFLILSACVTVEKHQLPAGSKISKQAAWQAHRATMESMQIWNLKGRVAGKSNNEGFRSGVQWNQLQHDFVIYLYGPLGRKVAVITGKQGNVQLKTSKGESFNADNPEKLMLNLFGYSLPVNGLQHWLLGIPDPTQVHAILELDDLGHLKKLNQAGWLIDYKRYHDGSPALPSLIFCYANMARTCKVKSFFAHYWST